mmetsp:Transcript_11144/g.50475  ORF Transcript_11144/g.50475 Transcript_11144/m.50475 type:complete len:241 (-) Transcript_11144:669-1391(-)
MPQEAPQRIRVRVRPPGDRQVPHRVAGREDDPVLGRRQQGGRRRQARAARQGEASSRRGQLHGALGTEARLRSRHRGTRRGSTGPRRERRRRERRRRRDPAPRGGGATPAGVRDAGGCQRSLEPKRRRRRRQPAHDGGSARRDGPAHRQGPGDPVRALRPAHAPRVAVRHRRRGERDQPGGGDPAQARRQGVRAHRRQLQRLRQGSAPEAAETAPGGSPLRRVRGRGPGAGREEGGRGDR